MKTVLAIDPGRDKCGLAVVTSESIVWKGIVLRNGAVDCIFDSISQYAVDEIIIGNGTGSRQLIEEITGKTSVPVIPVDETCSSMKARQRFFKDNPRRGIFKIIPVGLLTPDQPYDDYTAVILAEEYLKYNR